MAFLQYQLLFFHNFVVELIFCNYLTFKVTAALVMATDFKFATCLCHDEFHETEHIEKLNKTCFEVANFFQR